MSGLRLKVVKDVLMIFKYTSNCIFVIFELYFYYIIATVFTNISEPVAFRLLNVLLADIKPPPNITKNTVTCIFEYQKYVFYNFKPQTGHILL